MIPNEDGTDDRYRRKIVSCDELKVIIGDRPRAKSVVLCHGTFDLVHPGHLRHLMYARSQADILVVTLTSDAHISKANYRPYVPQDLRAFNLAALEVVDFVLIDDEAEPLNNLRFLQPDYYAKGYEYSAGGIHPRTQQEIDVLEEYGGEIILTPGDVVYSSSRFLEAAPPNLAHEKLLALMSSEDISFEDLDNALHRCADTSIHVVGDLIVDSYVFCSPLGSSTSKTPTISVKYEERVDYVGGAGVVARHLRATGADVRLTTLVGNDELGTFAREELDASEVRVTALRETKRPTTNKLVYVADGYRLLKVDVVDNRPIDAASIASIIAELSTSDAEVFVMSDFRHGIFTKEDIPAITAAIPSGRLRVADSQVASRWGNILEFKDFDLLTPNEKEARFATGDQDSVIRPLATELFRKSGCRLLVLKMGSRGVMVHRGSGDSVRDFFQIDSFAQDVVDPVGAGDALLAYTSVLLRTSDNPVIAAVLGTIAAGIACERDGNTPVTPGQMREKLASIERRLSFQ